MRHSLDGTRVLITGGNGLLGRELVTAFADEGAVVVNADVRNPSGLRSVTKNLYSLHMDICSETSVETGVGLIESELGEVNVLVNNAKPLGRHYGEDFLVIDGDGWSETVVMNLNGLFLVTRRVARLMIDHKVAGVIINIASIFGVVAPDFRVYEGTALSNPSEYAVIKGGVIAFTRYLATYLAPYHIRVNALSPGGIYDQHPERFVKAYESRTPLGRMASPGDISVAALFLAAQTSTYMTGQNLIIDGGWTAW